MEIKEEELVEAIVRLNQGLDESLHMKIYKEKKMVLSTSDDFDDLNLLQSYEEVIEEFLKK